VYFEFGSKLSRFDNPTRDLRKIQIPLEDVTASIDQEKNPITTLYALDKLNVMSEDTCNLYRADQADVCARIYVD